MPAKFSAHIVNKSHSKSREGPAETNEPISFWLTEITTQILCYHCFTQLCSNSRCCKLICVFVSAAAKVTKFPWCKAGQPHHLVDVVDWDQ